MTWQLTKEIEDEILAWIEGGKGLRAYERYNQVNNIERPCRSTILKWQRELKEFYTKCARAREASGELAAEELDDINDKIASGLLKPDAAKVISSNLQWKASKLASKAFGNTVTSKHIGGDEDDNPINIITRKAENQLYNLDADTAVAISELLNE